MIRKSLLGLIFALCFITPLFAKSFSQIKREFYRDYRSPDYAKRMEAVQQVANTGQVEGLKILVSVVLKVEPDQYVYEETLKFIKDKFTSAECLKYLGSQIGGSANWKVKLGLCRLAAEMKDEAITEGLIRAVGDSQWQVRSAAIFALRKHRNKKAIPALIERLGKEKGRMLGEVRLALRDLTGQDLGDSKESWKSWWKSNKDSFNPSAQSAPSESNVSRERLGTVLRRGGLYGTVYSTRVVFILDISGSMLEGTEAGKRIDVAKRELIKVIDQLPSKAAFNIIAYNQRVIPWKKTMIKASSSRKSAAAKWINSLTLDPNGLTATYDALEFVYLYDKNADTIYLLSDGSPTAGKITGQHQIIQKIKTLNRFRSLQINTIAFMAGGVPGEDKQAASQFMKEMAQGNSGKFKHIE